MIAESSLIDRIEVLAESGTIQVRRADRVLKDGIVIAETFHRHVLAPGANLTGEDPTVTAIARLVWNEEQHG